MIHDERQSIAKTYLLVTDILDVTIACREYTLVSNTLKFEYPGQITTEPACWLHNANIYITSESDTFSYTTVIMKKNEL